MTTLDLDQEQFCICCNLWGPAETMLPLYRFRDQEAKPCLWLHHHCAETCGNVQFEAGMKRFESQVHTVAQSQAGDAGEAIAKAHAQAQLAEAANRAAISLQALKRAKAALGRGVDDGSQAQGTA
jgi:hypothetical protein